MFFDCITWIFTTQLVRKLANIKCKHFWFRSCKYSFYLLFGIFWKFNEWVSLKYRFRHDLCCFFPATSEFWRHHHFQEQEIAELLALNPVAIFGCLIPKTG